jgi:hypothetical protein
MTLNRRNAALIASALFKETAYLTADPRPRGRNAGELRRRYVMRVTGGSIRAGRFSSDVLGSGANWEEAILTALYALEGEAKERGARFDPAEALAAAANTVAKRLEKKRRG